MSDYPYQAEIQDGFTSGDEMYCSWSSAKEAAEEEGFIAAKVLMDEAIAALEKAFSLMTQAKGLLPQDKKVEAGE